MAKNITLKAKLQGAQKTKKGLKGIDSGLKSLGKSALVAGAAFFGARAIISGLKKIVDLAGEQEMAEKKLEAALGRTSKALLLQASALQTMSMFGDEAIIEAQALIAAFVDDEEAIKKATQATLDLAAAKGMDLTAAADLVSKTLGSSTNAMSRYGIEVEGAVGSTERLDSLTGNIADKFGGQAKAQTETMAGAMQQMSMAVGDAGEKMGSLLAPAITNVAKWFGTAAKNVGDFFLKMTETSLQTSIRELEALGVSTLGLQLSYAKLEQIDLEKITKDLEDEEILTKNIVNSGNLIIELWKEKGRIQEDLLKQGTSEEELRKRIADLSDMNPFGLSPNQFLDQLKSAKVEREKAKVILAEIDLLSEIIMNQEALAKGNKEDLEVVKTLEITKEHILALEEALLENKKNQSGIKIDGEDEIEALIMSEEQKASIREEFNQRFLEMTVGHNELQNIELTNAVDRFREAGIEETEIAKFVAERKKAIDLDYKNSKISSVGSLVGAFGQLNQASKGSALISKRLAQGEATISTWVAVNKALAAGVPPFNIIQATAIGVMGLANVLKIEAQKFALGGDFVTSGPQMIMVGEAGRERVQVTPLQGPNVNGPQGGDVTVNIHGGIIQDDYVRNELIPAINKAKALA